MGKAGTAKSQEEVEPRMPCNVLLVLRKPDLIRQIRAILTSRGYAVSDGCVSGMQALRSAATHPVDIAIVGYTLNDMSGLDFSMDLLSNSDCSVLLMTPPDQMVYVKEQIGSADVVPVPRPVTAQALLSTLELIGHYRSKLTRANEETKKLKQDLDRRAVAEKAKVVLMNRLQMSEAEAWRYLQKRSMDTGTSLKEIALRVLELYKTEH